MLSLKKRIGSLGLTSWICRCLRKYLLVLIFMGLGFSTVSSELNASLKSQLLKLDVLFCCTLSSCVISHIVPFGVCWIKKAYFSHVLKKYVKAAEKYNSTKENPPYELLGKIEVARLRRYIQPEVLTRHFISPKMVIGLVGGPLLFLFLALKTDFLNKIERNMNK